MAGIEQMNSGIELQVPDVDDEDSGDSSGNEDTEDNDIPTSSKTEFSFALLGEDRAWNIKFNPPLLRSYPPLFNHLIINYNVKSEFSIEIKI